MSEDQVEMIFKSDDKIEQRGYYLVFTLVSTPLISQGKWDHEKMIKFIKFTKFISLLKFPSFYFLNKPETREGKKKQVLQPKAIKNV